MTKNATASEIFKSSLNIYKKRFWTLFLIALIPLLLIKVSDLALTSLISVDISRKIITRIISSIISTWGTLSLYQTISDKNTNLSKIFQKSWKKLFRFWLLNLIFGLVATGGFILFVIPGFLFLLWSSLSFWIYVDQGIGGFKALSLSRQYMKGNISYFIKKWFYICLISLIPLAILIIQSFLIKDETIINHLIVILTTSLMAPISYGYSYLIYQNIKSFNTEK